MTSGWVEAVAITLENCEAKELDLAYGNGCEKGRKSTGSYYTPLDVARFFWLNCFSIMRVVDRDSARDFVRKYEFVEPSAGSGMLFFALLEALGNIGLNLRDIESLSAHLVDINMEAAGFIERELDRLRQKCGDKFLSGIRVHRTDFLEWRFEISSRRVFCFGNPPFVSSAGPWRNSAFQFMDRGLDWVAAGGAMNFIMPLSICFSRDARQLRSRIRGLQGSSYFSNFDNIPDTLFKSGKPLNENSNKANSQRCTIATIISDDRRTLRATKLMRWKTSERARVLSHVPKYLRIDRCLFNDQFPRAESAGLIRYLSREHLTKIDDLLNREGRHAIFIAGVARNYIGVRESGGPGVLALRTDSLENYYRVLALLTSRAFFEYWLAMGDGFHVTQTVVFNFPISAEVLHQIDVGRPRVRKMWRNRFTFVKTKLNRGRVIESFDFSSSGLAIRLN